MGRCLASGLSLGAVMLLLTGAAEADCAPGTVELRWTGGQARFSVEVADTAAEREKGLMFRQSMASSAGMLFVYPAPQHAYFWMKNTLIPLDMVFVDATGRVNAVQSDAVPGDLTPIDGGADVAFVLEINAGLSRAMGIAPGAQMRAAEIDQAKALWRCAD